MHLRTQKDPADAFHTPPGHGKLKGDCFNSFFVLLYTIYFYYEIIWLQQLAALVRFDDQHLPLLI